MKAVEGTRYIKERTKLETVVPLDTPFVPARAISVAAFAPVAIPTKIFGQRLAGKV